MAFNVRNANVGNPADSGEARLREFLELRVWTTIPAEAGRRWSRDEEDALVGYGEWGEPA
jgi:hypothetical protein